MRRFIASSLTAVMLTLGVPLIGSANGTAASVMGQVVDASGRGSSGMTVELLKDGAMLGSTVSGADGRFTMNGIAPGTYVVRTMVQGRQAGVQVSLKAGESAPVVVVLPSMVTAAAQAQFASILANLSTTLAGTTMATVVTEVAAQAQQASDEQKVEDAVANQTVLTTLLSALNNAQLTAAQQQAVAQVVVQIVVSVPEQAKPELTQAVQDFSNGLPQITIPGSNGAPPIVITIPAPIVATGSGSQ